MSTKQTTVIAEQRDFYKNVTEIATRLLTKWVGTDRAGEAVGRVASALASAAASSKKPEEFFACTLQSIGSVVAISALTGIMVSAGGNALAYAIPRRPRQGEPPQLTYQLSHRGLAALAKRAGMMMIPIPISFADVIGVDDSGSVTIQDRDLDNPPTTEAELRGVAVVIKDIATGHQLFCGWVPRKIILARRDGSDAYKYASKNKWAQDSDPWHKWFVEQAMKTAMHYAASRGWCVIDDTAAVRALAMDSDNSRVIEGTVVERRTMANITEQLADIEAEEPTDVEGDEVLEV